MRVEGRTGGGGGGGPVIRGVLKRATFSRLLVAGLFLLWRILASPYDTSATLNPPCLGPNQGDSQQGPVFVTSVAVYCIFFFRLAIV